MAARGRLVESFSIAQRQLLAIARALSMNARILLMDEPTSSLFGDAVERLFGLVRDLKQRGVAIVYVSHKMDEIFRLCDRVTVLRDGETIGTSDIASTTPGRSRPPDGRPRGGGERAAAARAPPTRSCSRSRTSGRASLQGISFELRRGEVLGIAGLVGSGRSALGAALFGLDPILGGTRPRRTGRLAAGGSRRRRD